MLLQQRTAPTSGGTWGVRIPGIEVVRAIELRMDVPTARLACSQLHSDGLLLEGVSIVRFDPTFASTVASARSNRTADAFLQFYAARESGWLAIDQAGHVIGHCWRLHNCGDKAVRQQITIPTGYSWFHYEWADSAWRGRGRPGVG